MIFPVKNETNRKIPPYFELGDSIPKGLYVMKDDVIIINNDVFVFNDNRKKYLDEYYPFIYDDERSYPVKDDMITSSIEFYVNPYDTNIKIIVVDGNIIALECINEVGLHNCLFALKHPWKSLTNYIIMDNKGYSTSKDMLLKNVSPKNVVKQLEVLKTIRPVEEWFVTTKLDGVTCAMMYHKSSYKLIVFELSGQKVAPDSKILLEMNFDRNIWKEDVVFLGEWVYDEHSRKVKGSIGEYRLYLFLEANDIYGDYRIDVTNIKKFVKEVDDYRITHNLIVLPDSGEDYRDITKRLIALKKEHKTYPEIDGYVYGNIKTKFHLKWKPLHLITNDYYVIFGDDRMYLYVGNRRNDAIKMIKNRHSNYLSNLKKLEGDQKINARLIMSKHKNASYVKQLYHIERFHNRDMLFDENRKGKYSFKYNDDNSDGLIDDNKFKEKFDAWKEKYNNKIVEFKYENDMWIPYRPRFTKMNPNNIRTVDSNVRAIKHPIHESDLLV